MIKGVIIAESLVGKELPPILVPAVARRYSFLLDGTEPVEMIEVKIMRSILPQATFELANSLVAQGYYCHFIDANGMYVIFPQCICMIPRDDADALRRARVVGGHYSVPQHQMPFKEMFSTDHPNERP